MATLNFGSFFDGYYAEQKSQLADDANARAAEEAARAQAAADMRAQLFAQQQEQFRQEATLRELQRRAAEQQVTGGMELFAVTQPDAVDRARFGATTGAITRAAMLPIAAPVAALTADTTLTQARAAAAAGAANLGRAQVDASIFGDPAVQRDLVATGVTNAGVNRDLAAAGAEGAALKRVLARDERELMADPRTREIASATVRLAQETKLLDGLMQVGRMDKVNELLQPYGMEAKMEGAVPMTRPIGTAEWLPWAGAMSLPFYRQLAANLENAAQAHEREAAAAARAKGAAGGSPTPQPAAPAIAALGIPGATTGQPTPVAGRTSAPAPANGPGLRQALPLAADKPGPAGITQAQAYAQAQADMARVPNATYRDVVSRARLLYSTPRQATP